MDSARERRRSQSNYIAGSLTRSVNGDDFKAFIQHRAEVAELLERVGGASPHLHALSYTELWQQWDRLANLDWVPTHLGALSDRYAITL